MGCHVRERVTEPVSSVPVAFPRSFLEVVTFEVVTFEVVTFEMVALEKPWLEMVALEKPWLEKAAFEAMVTSSDML